MLDQSECMQGAMNIITSLINNSDLYIMKAYMHSTIVRLLFIDVYSNKLSQILHVIKFMCNIF